MKQRAKSIVSNISKGKEDITLTVVHVSEAANILKYGMPQDHIITIIVGLLILDYVIVMDVSKDAYFAATELDEDLKLEHNDALAVDIMRQNNISEINTFDEHFSQIDDITRLPIL